MNIRTSYLRKFSSFAFFAPSLPSLQCRSLSDPPPSSPFIQPSAILSSAYLSLQRVKMPAVCTITSSVICVVQCLVARSVLLPRRILRTWSRSCKTVSTLRPNVSHELSITSIIDNHSQTLQSVKAWLMNSRPPKTRSRRSVRTSPLQPLSSRPQQPLRTWRRMELPWRLLQMPR